MDEEKAVIHEFLLCEVSGFFQKKAGQKAIQNSFAVRDYSPNITWSTMLIFFNWIYFNDLYEVDDDKWEYDPSHWVSIFILQLPFSQLLGQETCPRPWTSLAIPMSTGDSKC